MNNDLFQRVLIQLEPELAQEFGRAIIEDEKKLKAFEIIKEHKLLNYVLKNEKCANMYHLPEADKDILKEAII